MASLRKVGGAEHGEFTIWLAGVECLRAEGDHDGARAVILEARASLERRLSTVQLDEDRDRVLSGLPEVALLERQAQALGLKFPKPPALKFPKAGLNAGAQSIRGES